MKYLMMIVIVILMIDYLSY